MMPDARLRAAASLVRQGAVLADIGTDHAYLPLYLLQEERITRALACDIGEGPLARAAAHIAAAGESARVRCVLCDGLSGLENEGLTDIAVCGMGGELIVSILSAAPFVRDGDIRLILQPMTRAAVLRRYLGENGFRVEEERLCRAGGRLYTCMAAVWDGVSRSLTPAEAEIGHPCVASTEEKALYITYLDKKIARLRRRLDGLRAASRTSEEDAALLTQMIEMKEKAL